LSGEDLFAHEMLTLLLTFLPPHTSQQQVRKLCPYHKMYRWWSHRT